MSCATLAESEMRSLLLICILIYLVEQIAIHAEKTITCSPQPIGTKSDEKSIGDQKYNTQILDGNPDFTFAVEWDVVPPITKDSEVKCTGPYASKLDGYASKVVKKGKKISISINYKVSDNQGDYGLHECIINSDPRTKVQCMTSIIPILSQEKDSQIVRTGDDATLKCSVKCAYPSATVIWTKHNDPKWQPSSGQIEKRKDQYILRFKKVTLIDEGLYTCNASNTVGRNILMYRLVVRNRLAPLWPFLGILSEVIIVVCIILMYERRHILRNRCQYIRERFRSRYRSKSTLPGEAPLPLSVIDEEDNLKPKAATENAPVQS